MSREIRQELYLEFEPKDKAKVLEQMDKDGLLAYGKIQEQDKAFIGWVGFNYDFETDDFFENYKNLCSYITKAELEVIDELSYIWEKDE